MLPEYNLDEIIADIKKISTERPFKKVKFKFEIIDRQDPTPITAKNSEIVKLLMKTIQRQRGFTPSFYGMSGSTCAVFLRKKGMPVAVWDNCSQTAHRPNEYANINYLLADAKVFATLFIP